VRQQQLAMARPAAADRGALLVTGDRDLESALTTAFGAHGARLVVANTCLDAERNVAQDLFDLLIVDALMPGEDAIRMARECLSRRPSLRWLAIVDSAFGAEAHCAARFGALDVVEKPLDSDYVLAVRDRICNPTRQDRELLGQPGSVPERWAAHVLRGAQCSSDLKTLARWARQIGVSYSSLCEHCRLVRIQPRDARDFARCFRAVIQSHRLDCPPEAVLDVGDRRTLSALLARAGPAFVETKHTSVLLFLRTQLFVDARSPALAALRTATARTAQL
jgi:ActR/RegA family two-component response regulator